MSTTSTFRARTSATARWLGFSLGTGFASFQGWLLVMAVVGGFFTSGPTAVVAGGSMEPAMRRGDVVLNESMDGAGPVIGAVVVFEAESRLVTHRVVDLADGKVQTQGDANRSPDSTWQPVQQLQGQARLVVPFVGLPSIWVRESNWPLLGLWVVAAVAAFDVAFRRPRESDEASEAPAVVGAMS